MIWLLAAWVVLWWLRRQLAPHLRAAQDAGQEQEQATGAGVQITATGRVIRIELDPALDAEVEATDVR